jgi:putative chitinase
MKITPNDLIAIYSCSRERAETFCTPINLALLGYEIDNPLRVAAFLAQVGHESTRLRYVREIWGPETCHWQTTYEGREDLGNVFPGDGYKFRGRGLIQITGRSNYQRCGDALSLPLTEQPELLERPLYAAACSGWYWQDRGLNELADRGDFRRITKRINPGMLGYEDRLQLFNKITDYFNTHPQKVTQ